MSRDLQFLLSGTQRSTYINVVGLTCSIFNISSLKRFVFNYASRCISGQAYVHECSTCRVPGFPGGTGCFELSNEGSGN